MEQICDKNKCSGCCACMNACPKNCISMEYDEYGVQLPVVDKDKCVDCGLCARVCPVNTTPKLNDPKKAIAAWHLDDEIRKKSASGGVAAAFYETTLEAGGVCYGTVFDEDLKLVIKKAENMEQIKAFKGSKYVQAYVGYTFKDVKKELERDKSVTYIGTPCQIAGLKSYLKKDYDKLVTVDLICHGVPSIKYLQDHVKDIEAKINKKADDISFRGEYSFELTLYENKEVIFRKYRFLDNYFTGFLNGLFYRNNCYSCPYARQQRVSDITIGDFWGLGQEAPCNYSMSKGISVILPNTEKGLEFVKKASDKLFMEERPLTEAVNGNDQLRHPSEKHANYRQFMDMYPNCGFEKSATECTKKDIAEFKKEERKKNVRRVLSKGKRICKKIIGRQ